MAILEPDALSLSVCAAAIAIGAIHTALGPDHYLPFVMLARVRRWGVARTVAITTACGIGHVASSLLVGVLGLLLGLGVGRLESVESARGGLAAWALVAVGLAYALWGIRRALRRRHDFEPHRHGETVHLHRHGSREHRHDGAGGHGATFWALFAVFVLGPCEPLIPLFILPASRGRWGLAFVVASVFALVTVATMVGLTLLGLYGARQVALRPLERWSHALAGTVIAASGLAIIFLGV